MTISVIGAPGAGGQRLRSPQRAVAIVRAASSRAVMTTPKQTRVAAALHMRARLSRYLASGLSKSHQSISNPYCAEALRAAVGLASTILSNSSLSMTCDHIG